MRLNQYLAACGLGSRRHCEALIAAGRVNVNGVPGHFGVRVGEADRIEVDGRLVTPQRRGEVWMLHKPAGVLTSSVDPEGRTTVSDLIRRHGLEERLFPVGRLDFDTTGLLLLTNDGDLGFRLTHPSWGVEKEYEARVETPLTEAELEALRQGVEIEDGRTAPCDASQERGPRRATVRLVLHEGRKRQVRRMLAALGHPVLALHRVRVGPLRLGDLRAGAMRRLDPAERAALEAELEQRVSGGTQAQDQPGGGDTSN